ncbi:TetR/AcrR family transcriptional regulator [Caulobacter sp. RHG1]|uniref:TetR/AcrR family transcriptional regulator n=1 Tax=Caulobacter sp. (strain RHG1) TaxID=2545762 RepID=UPI00155443E4|nr:TetR/AcrR family transcriptional regulator [Caulobacter sp. RHG1]NQE60947.1 Transcriptional regulator, AcrR family [Caulobacter sp. RHG1]
MLVGAGLKRSSLKREEILASARSLFLRTGYSDAGMEVVARTAGVSTATLYAYFPSKADLFKAIVMETVTDVAAPVREAARAKGDARTRLTALACAYAAFFARSDVRGLFRMVTAERRRFEDVAEYFLQSARDELGGAMLAVINDLIRAGELKVDKPSWAAGQLMGMLDHVTLVLGLSAGDDIQSRRPVQDIAEDAVETFLARYGASRKNPLR